MVVDRQTIAVQVERSAVRTDHAEVVNNSACVIGSTSSNRVTEVDAVLNTRDRTRVVQCSLEADTVDRTETACRSAVAFRGNCASVVDRASEQTSCCCIKSTTNSCTLKTDTIAC